MLLTPANASLFTEKETKAREVSCLPPKIPWLVK
jgi:hypothetical protein